MTFSADLVDALHQQNSADGLLELIEITHPDLAEPLRIANERGGGVVNALGVQWAKFAVDLQLPDELEEGTPEVRIVFSNVSGVIGQTLQALTTTPNVTIYGVKFSDLNSAEQTLSSFIIENITIDLTTVSVKLAREPFSREPIPSQRFLPQWFQLLGRSRSE